MLAARQLLLMRRVRDRTIGVAIAPIGTVALLPDPDFRRRVLRCVSHVGLSRVARGLAEWIEITARQLSHPRSASRQIHPALRQRRFVDVESEAGRGGQTEEG